MEEEEGREGGDRNRKREEEWYGEREGVEHRDHSRRERLEFVVEIISYVDKQKSRDYDEQLGERMGILEMTTE